MIIGARFGAKSILDLKNGESVYLENTVENVKEQMADASQKKIYVTISAIVSEDINYELPKEVYLGIRQV